MVVVLQDEELEEGVQVVLLHEEGAHEGLLPVVLLDLV